MTRCVSDLAVEALLLSRPAAGVAEHVESCPRCQERVLQARREGAIFQAQIAPRVLDAVLERAVPRRRMPSLLFLLPVPVAALAALLLVLLRAPTLEPSGDYVGTKGGLGFAVFSSDGTGAVALADGSQVAGTARLRFKLQIPRACHALIVSLDDTGQLSQLFPAGGDRGVLLERSGALPGGAVLTGTGPERLFAICSPSPIAFSQLASTKLATRSADAVRGLRLLPGLPAGALQATLLLERTP